MASKEEVENFLRQFFQKLKVFDIIFLDNRDKNARALVTLDIKAHDRIGIIKKIKVKDYSEGPIIDTLNGRGDMWVFGKDVKKREVYIKISLGHPDTSTICISFHLAEHPMKYPYKDNTVKKGSKR